MKEYNIGTEKDIKKYIKDETINISDIYGLEPLFLRREHKAICMSCFCRCYTYFPEFGRYKFCDFCSFNIKRTKNKLVLKKTYRLKTQLILELKRKIIVKEIMELYYWAPGGTYEKELIEKYKVDKDCERILKKRKLE